ncbi:hypothetical protein BC827DRAFT_1271999 [Russula dissimulans]|nr:hypothetical protein BC827DRAFT_1271999 [Russula dissimulans]
MTVVFLLLKQFSAELLTEAEVFLTLLIKLVGGETEAGEHRPGWMNFSMEIMRGSVTSVSSSADFMRSIRQRYDALATDGDANSASGPRIFTILISALKRPITLRPSLLGVSGQMQGVAINLIDSLPHIHGHTLDRVAGMVAAAARATVSNVVMIAQYGGCAAHSRGAYVSPWRGKFLVSLSDGLAGFAIPLYNTLAVQKPPSGSSEPVRARGPLDPSTLPETEPARVGLQSVRAMLNAGWSALLAALSFFTTTLSDLLFGDVLGALQALAQAAGCLALPTPRDAFLTALAKAALPPRVAAELDEPGGGGGGGPPQLPGLSQHNLACLRALVAAAVFLAGMLGPSWFAVLEALQIADYVLTTRGTTQLGSVAASTGGAAGTPSKRGAAQVEGQVGTGQLQLQQQRQQVAHPLLADADPESVQAAM